MDIKLNLISPLKKEEIKKKKIFLMALRSEVVLTIMLMVFFFVLFSFRYILDIELASEASLNSEIKRAEQFVKIKEYDDKINEANEKTKQIALIDNEQLYWSGVFIKLGQIIYSGVSIKSFTTSDYETTVSGLADTRDNLLKFKEGLESESCFSDISLPLSNLVDKENVDFKIVFKAKEECLKRELK